jgi:cAMP-dependent protein kinase regulator
LAPTQGFIKKVVPKTTDQVARILRSVSTNFLFKHLEEEHAQDVVNAMIQTPTHKDQVIIAQGDAGDFFYVVQSGTFDCLVGTTQVTSYEPGGSLVSSR